MLRAVTYCCALAVSEAHVHKIRASDPTTVAFYPERIGSKHRNDAQERPRQKGCIHASTTGGKSGCGQICFPHFARWLDNTERKVSWLLPSGKHPVKLESIHTSDSVCMHRRQPGREMGHLPSPSSGKQEYQATQTLHYCCYSRMISACACACACSSINTLGTI